MLCLTDESLARIAIGATAVPAKERGDWLETLARKFEAPDPTSDAPSRAAEYTRRWRARAQNGEILLRPIVDEAAFAVAAVDAGMLDPLRADDKTALTKAAEKVIAMFSTGELSPHDTGIHDKVRSELLATVRKLDVAASELSPRNATSAAESTRRPKRRKLSRP
jgi:hypothetical protein